MIDLPQPTKRYDNDTDHDSCVICGKAITNAHPYMIHLVAGGLKVANDKDDWQDDMGWHPIGLSCLAKYPQLKNYVLRI